MHPSELPLPTLRRLFPPGTAVEAQYIRDRCASLFPAELQTVSRAVQRRREEFSTGRVCARGALEALGAPGGEIPVGSSREPVWPAGYVGAITHDAGLCIAVARRPDRVSGIGIDLADSEPLPPEVRTLVCTAEELSDPLIRDFAPADGFKLVFSAKEALYKVLFPILRRFVDFQEVRVRLDPEQEAWRPEVLPPHRDALPARISLEGRFLVTDRHIVTSAWSVLAA